MLDKNEFQICWQNEPVGLLVNPTPDMWYMDGEWVSNRTTAAVNFESAVIAVESQDIFNNLRKGVEVTLQDYRGKSTLAIIIALGDNRLFLRRIAVSLK